MLWVVLIASWVVCAGFAAHLAEVKGYNSNNWFWLGLLFGGFALLAAVGLPDRSQQR